MLKYVLTSGLVASACCGAANAAPTIMSSVFAVAPAGASGPDSVTIGAGSVWIAYDGNPDITSDGTLPTGNTTVARYSFSGALQTTYAIAGDVDGLKYNPSTGIVWAVQNQDARSHLTLIDPATNVLTPVSFAVTSPTQGVDDVAFTKNGTFLSFTNPSSLSDVTLQKVTDGTNPIAVTPILAAGSPGVNRATGQPGYVPPTQNTDSLKVAPNGDLVQTTGARDTLAFVHDAGLPTQTLSYLPLSAAGAKVAGLDDTLYLTGASGTIFASATNANEVFRIDYSGVAPGTLIASVGSLNAIEIVDPATGNLSPFAPGLSGIHGLDLVGNVPEPASLALLTGGLAGLLGLRRRR